MHVREPMLEEGYYFSLLVQRKLVHLPKETSELCKAMVWLTNITGMQEYRAVYNNTHYLLESFPALHAHLTTQRNLLVL